MQTSISITTALT